jgi:hypothetical protein
MTPGVETRLDGSTLIVRIPMRFQHRGGRKRIVAPDGMSLRRLRSRSPTAHWSRPSCGHGDGSACWSAASTGRWPNLPTPKTLGRATSAARAAPHAPCPRHCRADPRWPADRRAGALPEAVPDRVGEAAESAAVKRLRRECGCLRDLRTCRAIDGAGLVPPRRSRLLARGSHDGNRGRLRRAGVTVRSVPGQHRPPTDLPCLCKEVHDVVVRTNGRGAGSAEPARLSPVPQRQQEQHGGGDIDAVQHEMKKWLKHACPPLWPSANSHVQCSAQLHSTDHRFVPRLRSGTCTRRRHDGAGGSAYTSSLPMGSDIVPSSKQ